MRISTHQAFLTGLRGLLDGQANVTNLQEQIASGKRVNTPADDPIAAPQIIALRRQVDLLNQYEANANVAKSRLNLEESALDSITNSLQKIRQLAVQGGDGALDAGSRQGIAVELNQRVEELLGLVNTRGPDNEYIFSGYQANTETFVRKSGGGFTYQGDEGQLQVPVSSTLNIPITDSGKSLFADISVPNNYTVTEPVAPAPLNTGTGVAQNSVVTNQATYDAFSPDDAVITFSVAGPTTTYSVTRASNGAAISGGVPAQPLTNIPYVPGDAIAFEGVQLEIVGSPANGDEFTALHSNPEKQDILTIVEQLANGLNSLGNGEASNLKRGELISDALLSLDNALTSINQATAKIGARLNTIENVESANADIKLLHENTLSKIEDLDYTEAISLLTQSSFVLEAAQQSYLKVNNLSLFNFLR